MQAIADTVHKSVGFTKNCFDLFNICITITVGLVCQGHLIGIGLGTVVAVIGVGRVIAIFNHGFKKKWMSWQSFLKRMALASRKLIKLCTRMYSGCIRKY